MAISYCSQCDIRCRPAIFIALVFCATLLSTSEAENYSSLSPEADTRLGYIKSPSDDGSVLQETQSVKDVSDIAQADTAIILERWKRTARHSLCDGRCDCKMKTHFPVVECNLLKNQNYIFGIKNYIPPETTSLIVKLAPKATLRIEADFLTKTKVNRISIVGEGDTNKIHVEFRTNSSTKSLGPNPEITIENCHTLVLREYSIGSDVILKIKNCHEVIFFENALYSAKMLVHIDNVQDLNIFERAFNEAIGILRIYRSNIENLYRFGALFREVAFYNCTIGSITNKTFDVLKINAIIFDNCRIKAINTKAITEKLFGDHLKIVDAHIGVIESEAIYGSGISEVVFSNNYIDTIQSNAIHVTAANALITNNRILRVGLEWLRIIEWTNIVVSNNTFGEFNLMILEERNDKSAKCLFEKNLITHAMPGSLNLTNKNCIIREIAFDHICKCLKYDNWLEKLTSRDIRSESYCKIEDDLKFCFNRSQLNVLKYENEVCSESSTTLDCMKQRNLKFIDGEFIKPQEFEQTENNYLYYIIAASIALSLFIAAIIIAFRICIRKRKSVANESFDITTFETFTARNRFSKDDRRIISQTLELVKQNYSNDTYEELHKHVQNLLKENIDEPEMVQTIAEILQIINNCENSGDRFVAFTAILENLLQPADNNRADPVYAEPQFQNAPIYNHTLGGQTDIEHIYNEPLGVQQPLLTNEYATPADRNDIPAVYAEPIINDRERNIIAPYAAVTPKTLNNNVVNTLAQKPSTSQNLPDVLNSSSTRKELTNVQKLAQNFASNPNFHITRSPSTNRRIPKYTVPNKVKPVPVPVIERGRGSPETRSNHSGGSDITVKIDDIDYADA